MLGRNKGKKASETHLKRDRKWFSKVLPEEARVLQNTLQLTKYLNRKTP